MPENSRIMINVNSGEFELEGSEDFIDRQIAALPEIIKTISGSLPNPSSTVQDTHIRTDDKTQPPKVNPPKPDVAPINSIPNNFGEWFHRFPKKIAQIDLALITGYYQQKISQDNAFETGEVTSLLKEQGINLSNPAVFLKSLQQNKNAIIIEKRGKLNRFRISPQGVTHIEELLQAEPTN